MVPPSLRIDDWLDALAERHLADLRFAEVRRAIQALSRRYLFDARAGAPLRALDGRGKRAAFALYFAPLHLLTVRDCAAALDLPRCERLLDLGCGTGAASLGWALAAGAPRRVRGIDASPWACAEAERSWRGFGVAGRASRGDVTRGAWRGGGGDGVVLGWTVNELDRDGRARLLEALERSLAAGAALLVVEPISRRVAPWWDDWEGRLAARGGRADEWRFREPLPARLAELDRAAGLDHRERTARTLYVPATPPGTARRRPART